MKLSVLACIHAIFIALVFICATYQPKPPPVEVDAANSSLSEGGGRVMLDGAPFSGWIVEHFPNGGIKSRTGYLSGRVEGKAEEWSSDGVRVSSRYYHRGQEAKREKSWSQQVRSNAARIATRERPSMLLEVESKSR